MIGKFFPEGGYQCRVDKVKSIFSFFGIKGVCIYPEIVDHSIEGTVTIIGYFTQIDSGVSGKVPFSIYSRSGLFVIKIEPELVSIPPKD